MYALMMPPPALLGIWTNPDGKNGMEVNIQVRALEEATLTIGVRLGLGINRITYHANRFLLTGVVTLRLSPLTSSQLPGFGA